MKRGFSLLEIMIVIVIISILALIGIPTYDYYKRRAVVSDAQQELMSLSTVQEDYFNSFRRYAPAAQLRDFYGVMVYADDSKDVKAGAHFQIRVVLANPPSSYTATGYICFDKTGMQCTPGSEDTKCTIANGADMPTCDSY